jgi:hypothetical protein
MSGSWADFNERVVSLSPGQKNVTLEPHFKIENEIPSQH